MGFGDPYHKHPLSPSYVNREAIKADCFHCEFPIDDERCYRCERCNFYIHEFCGNLPETMRHPLHHQHPLTLLTLFASSSSDAPTSNLCNKCQKPCLEGFAYYCHTCQFILHVKCCFTLNHEKHHHPLHFNDLGGFIFKQTTRNCNICGYPINKFSFACWGCSFFIHYDCSIIPPTIKHHHTHELTIRYDFPKECDQVYCDMCEDRDGKLDRTLSYYYCKECDYIAHVLCVTQPKEDTMLFKRFTHEHPLRFATKDLLRCNQCDYSVKTSSREYPSSIKHPRHLEHNLTYVEGKCLYKCTDCEFTFTSNINSTFIFTHPYYRDLCFCSETSPFRCNACGELGKGSRMNSYRDFDLHLECFALPGKLEHESHPCHTLYLSLNPAEDSLHTLSPSQYCNVCTKEICCSFGFPRKTSNYCCLDCDYVAHLACVANELLSTLRSSVKNEPGFCAIVEPDEKTFELHLEQFDQCPFPRPLEPLLRKLVKSKEDDDDAKRSADLVAEEVDGVVCCPRCNAQISIRTKDKLKWGIDSLWLP